MLSRFFVAKAPLNDNYILCFHSCLFPHTESIESTVSKGKYKRDNQQCLVGIPTSGLLMPQTVVTVNVKSILSSWGLQLGFGS